MKIIGFTGAAYSGKDTAALELEEMIQEQAVVKRFAFADPLKEAAAVLFGVHIKMFQGENKKLVNETWNITYRDMLQKLGTDFAREVIDPEFWTKRIHEEVLQQKAQGMDFCIFTDVRFDNEAEYIQKMGGIIVEVQRPSLKGCSDLTTAEKAHKSEKGINPTLINHTLINQGTLKNFQVASSVLFKSFL